MLDINSATPTNNQDRTISIPIIGEDKYENIAVITSLAVYEWIGKSVMSSQNYRQTSLCRWPHSDL